ncbi:hypothetical protein [Eilatimonas milleporae]|nr:hypothetical protein [Eilatimonas milleporae]
MPTLVWNRLLLHISEVLSWRWVYAPTFQFHYVELRGLYFFSNFFLCHVGLGSSMDERFSDGVLCLLSDLVLSPQEGAIASDDWIQSVSIKNFIIFFLGGEGTDGAVCQGHGGRLSRSWSFAWYRFLLHGNGILGERRYHAVLP